MVQRQQSKLEARLGNDDLLGQVRYVQREVLAILETAKATGTHGGVLQAADRVHKGAALLATLLERSDVVGPRRYAIRWLDPLNCPHHPDGDCPLRSSGPVEPPPNGSSGSGATGTNTAH